jgi:hypothetical protein
VKPIEGPLTSGSLPDKASFPPPRLGLRRWVR